MAEGTRRIAVLLTLSVTIVSLSYASVIRRETSKARVGCDSNIYCHGDLLKTVQLAELFNDSKSFVDTSLLFSPSVVQANFNKLMQQTNNKPNRTQVKTFVDNNFVLKDELSNATLPDWTANPPILYRIDDSSFRAWASGLNNIWKSLARKMDADVANNSDRHSLIYVPNVFVIPGGRFREFYYWDSYWVIKGLLLCGMNTTARGMIDNFIGIVDKFGFIPNGGRIYYLMRSQPPLLTQMVDLYLRHTNDYAYLSKQISKLEEEFAFWQEYKMVDVRRNGKTYRMARYVTNDEGPRPESYKEDYKMAQALPEDQRPQFYNQIKAGAESGWDFSGRWFMRANSAGNLSLVNISTSNIIPVDLNAFLQKNAFLLSKYHDYLGNKQKSQEYGKIAENLQLAIEDVLWDEQMGTWFDYDNKNNQPRKNFYPSNLTPLYTGTYNASKVRDIPRKVVNYLKKQKIDVYFGGTPSSLNYTGEQWDYPNAWPPLQSLIIMGLAESRVKEAVQFGRILASRWLRSNYLGYEDTGKMFEKYNAIQPGEGGGGGEYNVQEGFGWTNGVVYELLDRFPDIKSVETGVEGTNNEVSSNSLDR